MSTWSSTSQQSVFKWHRIRVTNSSKSFTHKMAPETSWHRYGTKLRHCRPVYTVPWTHLSPHRNGISTETHTHRPRYSSCNNRPHLATAANSGIASVKNLLIEGTWIGVLSLTRKMWSQQLRPSAVRRAAWPGSMRMRSINAFDFFVNIRKKLSDSNNINPPMAACNRSVYWIAILVLFANN